MIRVRMLTSIAGKPSYGAGEIVDLEDRIAKAWIEDGLAILVREDRPAERATR